MNVRSILLLFFGGLLMIESAGYSSPQVVEVADNSSLIRAVRDAKPGTKILIAPGRYRGGLYFDQIHGTYESPIVIAGADPNNPPVIEGGGECLHLSEAAYLEIRDLILRGVSGNGLNIDDGGSYETPSHHILLENLTVQDVGPEGNRDGIKLSGVDEFEVRNCRIERWGSDGSGIDMVGCHQGWIVGCVFRHGDDVGANSIQMKGGSREIFVQDCRFEHGGSRAINIGGSTGLDYFRPYPHRGYEAQDIVVERCVFHGSAAPVAFVGVDGAIVRFNSFYYPKRWVIRILQETRDADFVPCRNGVFSDNLIVFRATDLRSTVNIGPGTAPESFRFRGNHWICADDPACRPELPIPEINGVSGGSLTQIDSLPMENLPPIPRNNPTARYDLDWTEEIAWQRVVSIDEFDGETPDEKLDGAQRKLSAEGGGVVYFPPGVYRFRGSIYIRDGIVLRGADPTGTFDARSEFYELPTRFIFPRYIPILSGNGTPNETAFKGIYLDSPGTDSNCGVVNLDIQRGHICFQEAEEHKSGRNRLVYGCILRNAAVADPDVPDLSLEQHPWQRFTARHHAAISVITAENALIANNRIPWSGEDSFLMPGYVLGAGEGKTRVIEEGVLFDYDNRPGITVNSYAIGGSGSSLPDGTPETHPHGFRKGIAIRDNAIFSTGRCAIAFCGDGVVCRGNLIRFRPEIVRWTVTGRRIASGSSTNDNRAVQMRGWRWMVADNDYEVYRNRVGGSSYYINDGEGLMHEDHVNSTVKDSMIVNNRGNAYISIYKTGGIDGLIIRGNEIRTSGGIAAICVVANRNWGKFPCRNVLIENNITAGGGIQIAGDPAENNVIRNNRHEGSGGKLINEANALVEDNQGYSE